jgi:hypothetical protein
MCRCVLWWLAYGGVPNETVIPPTQTKVISSWPKQIFCCAKSNRNNGPHIMGSASLKREGLENVRHTSPELSTAVSQETCR